MKRRIYDNSEVEAAKINARAVIIAALITGIGGTWLGSILESNKVQMTINQTFYEIIEKNENSDITLEEIKQNYIQLQSDFDSVEQQNETLANEKTSETAKLTSANEKISALQNQSKQEIEELNSQIKNLESKLQSMPVIDFKNLALCIDVNDVSINTNKSAVSIDGRDYFSREIVEKLITEDRNITIKNSTIFIGQVVAEKAKLTDQWLMGNLRCSIEDSSIDSHGNTHTDCIVLGNESYYRDSEIKYSVGGKYDSIKGTISVASISGMGNKGTITIKADDEVIYSAQLNKDLLPYPLDKPINNCEIIDISYSGNTGFFVIFSEATLYNK